MAGSKLVSIKKISETGMREIIETRLAMLLDGLALRLSY